MYDFVPVANRLMTKDDIKKQLYNMMDQLPLHGGSNGSMLPLVQIEEVIAEIKFKELVKQIDNALSKPRTKRKKSQPKDKTLKLPAPIPAGWLMVNSGCTQKGDKYFDSASRKFCKAPPNYRYDSFACLIRKDPKDYKKICENLSKRIGRLHTVASNLTDSMHKRDMPEPGELGRLLKRIAYGQP